MASKILENQVERLKTRRQFLNVQKGERRKGALFTLEVLDRNCAKESTRVGFTVTKRQGNAVVRNRIRRRLREAVRLSGQFAMLPGHDYVFVGQRSILTIPFETLKKSISKRLALKQKDRRI